jgi:hypothetical protein
MDKCLFDLFISSLDLSDESDYFLYIRLENFKHEKEASNV